MRQLLKRSSLLRRTYYRLQRGQSQSDETRIIDQLSANAPKTFTEFGFHPIQFNCSALADRSEWTGLLIDGSKEQVEDARALLPDRHRIICEFLTLDNLDFIRNEFRELGVLSIDVDGNDYWFLKELIGIMPTVICVEYNSSFGLDPVTIPYDKSFDRHRAHSRGWYHGASLTALSKLCAASGYGLAAVSEGGANAFFTKSGNLDPTVAWRPNVFREQISGVSHNDQMASIRGLPIVTV